MVHFVQLSHIRLADCAVAAKTRGAELADASLAADVRAGAVWLVRAEKIEHGKVADGHAAGPAEGSTCVGYCSL